MSSPAEDPHIDENHPGLDATRPEEDPSKDRHSRIRQGRELVKSD